VGQIGTLRGPDFGDHYITLARFLSDRLVLTSYFLFQTFIISDMTEKLCCKVRVIYLTCFVEDRLLIWRSSDETKNGNKNVFITAS